jgi:hypothetical protein
MASFGIGDAIAVSQLCYSLYQACSSGRKGASAAVTALANELWACSTALDQLAAAASRPVGLVQTPDLQNVAMRMISGCRSSLESLQKLIAKYESINEDSSSSDRRKWVHKLRITIKKSRWMYEEEEIKRIRSRIETNVQALNLLLNTITGYHAMSIIMSHKLTLPLEISS